MAPSLPELLKLMPWSHVKAEWSYDTKPHTRRTYRNYRNLVILWDRAHLLSSSRGYFVLWCLWDGLGGKSIFAKRTVYVQNEIVTIISHSEWCPSWILACLMCQPLHSLLLSFILQTTTSKKMVSTVSVRRGLHVTQSGEQTTSSNG